ncbi:MAG: thiol-disulfide oxidoreductase DCC family protein [Bacteroidia bacterium]
MENEKLPGKILFFDGNCALCNRWVKFVLQHEKAATLYFSPLLGETAKRLLQGHHPLPDSLIVFDNGKLFSETSAVLSVCSHLKWYWQWALVFHLVPSQWLNPIYRWVARNRMRWFGKVEYCAVLENGRARFLE